MRRRELLTLPAFLWAQSTPIRNLILFTSDGLRWQDVFNGIDPKLMGERAAHMHEARHLRDRFWREAPEERRAALMPRFWGRLAGQASISSEILVTNAFKVSYPGYSEILTGRTQDDVIRGNEPKQNPSESFLEVLKRHWRLDRAQAAVIASWNAYEWMAQKTPGSLEINCGYTNIGGSPRMEELSRMQHQMMSDEPETRHDWITFEIALEYIRLHKPRVFYVALDETDEWAHKKRYDRYLQMIHYVDECLDRLWTTVESMPEYRGSTALVVTSDHGRGSTLDTWTSHGSRIPGADRTWLAVIGAGRPPVGELAKRQCDIAPMILRMAGVAT